MRLSALSLALVGLAGLLTGVVLGVLASVLSESGPSGEGWSLRGNGALIVPFGLGPAVLAAGWSGLVAHFRSSAGWPLVGLGAGLVGVALVAVSLLALVLAGAAGAPVAAAASLLAAVWMLAAPLATLLLVRRREAPASGAGALHLLAAAVLPATMVAGFYLTQRTGLPGL